MGEHGDRESWSQVPGLAGLWASDAGRIATLKDGGGFAHLAQHQNQCGEMVVTLRVGGRRNVRLVAGLVLAAHGHPRPAGWRLGHRDGDPSNVTLDNLLWERKGQPRVVELKERLCLGKNCGATFMSSGPGNRLCSSCVDHLKGITLSGFEGAEEASELPDEPMFDVVGNPHK